MAATGKKSTGIKSNVHVNKKLRIMSIHAPLSIAIVAVLSILVISMELNSMSKDMDAQLQ